MIRLLVAAGLALWLGASLLLAGWSRLGRPSLAERLAPFHPSPPSRPLARTSAASSLGALAGELARTLGDRLSGLLGVSEPVSRRLRRVHSPLDATRFRLRELAWMLAVAAAALATTTAGLPLALAVLLLAGGPLLAFLLIEQRLASSSKHWQDQVGRELPIVAEQLATLLNAGFSLGSALSRLAGRGRGCCATDLVAVTNRIHQGVSEVAALEEWAELVGVAPLTRLVRVLALQGEAPDLGRLVSAEARQTRKELQRRTVEEMERRGEQVWIPVSVAALVPGAILLAVPVLAALRVFANA
ncbi:MAG: type II secretion system F family protein [Actinomycetota bacterium]|nr:type II secretion system F family protein [Actinomycetota bacterium]